MNTFKYSAADFSKLSANKAHQFAMVHSMMLYEANALYSFIPKNACSTLRFSVAKANGCVSAIEEGHWIHMNNSTFNASLGEAVKAAYTFTILRCPYRRLASLFLDKFVSKEPPAWGFRDHLDRTVELDDVTFREFVSHLKDPEVQELDIHWRPQVDFLIYEQYSDYFSLENFKHAISTLKEKINFEVVDARGLTNHGLDGFEMKHDHCYADFAAFDIALMKRKGQCPDHKAMYDKDLYRTVSELYAEDIELYTEKFGAADLLSENVISDAAG